MDEGNLRVLAESTVFARIPKPDLSLLAEIMRRETFAAGSTVIEAGEAADSVFVVASGVLSVFLPHQSVAVRQLRRGDVLGEYGMVGHALRTATVRVDDDAVVLALDYERFREYLHRFPSAMWILFASAVARLNDLEGRLPKTSA